MQISSEIRAELTGLVASLREGSIAETEARRLNQLVVSDPQIAWLYLQAIDVEAWMHWQHAKQVVGELAERAIGLGAAGHVEAAIPSVELGKIAGHSPAAPAHTSSSAVVGGAPYRAINFSSRPIQFSILVSLILFVVGMTVFGIWTIPEYRRSSPTPAAASDFVAEISDARDCVWAGVHRGDLAPGWKLERGQELHLLEGFAEVKFNGGAKAILEGPANFIVGGDNSGRLNDGKLVGAIRTEGTPGFTIETPTMTIVDTGTEFGVEVDAGRVRVHVFEGSVDLQRARGDGAMEETMRLSAGEGILLDSTGDTKKIKIPATANGFQRALPPPLRSIVVRPEFVAGENYERLQLVRAGEASPDGATHSYDTGLPGPGHTGRSQFMWFDFSSSLTQLPPGEIESVEMVWEGLVKATTSDVSQERGLGARTGAANLGVFAVPDDRRGVITIFDGDDGNDNIDFYAARAEEAVAVFAVPEVAEPRRVRAKWNVTPLVRKWLEAPEDPLRGQLVLVNDRYPVWVDWSGSMPRWIVRFRSQQE